MTLVDVLTVAAGAVLALVLVLPQARVRALLGNEDEVIADLADLERRAEAHKASNATDRDANGRGEYGPLAAILGTRAVQFERLEGTDVYRRGGYYFTVLLPDAYYLPVPAQSADVKPEFAEVSELIVAWPADPGRSGMRAYARWPGGVLLQHAIDGFPYTASPPFPRVPLVRRDAKGIRIADRYAFEDWKPPVFASGRREPKER